jgi:hypothetical protein
MTFLGILTELDQIHALRVIKKILTKKNPLYHHTEFGFKSIVRWVGYIPEFNTRLFVANVKSEGKKKEFVVLKWCKLSLKFLQHLETFSCSFYLRNLDIDDMTGIGQFCEKLRKIFDSQEGSYKKSFKFRLLANDENKLDNYGR